MHLLPLDAAADSPASWPALPGRLPGWRVASWGSGPAPQPAPPPQPSCPGLPCPGQPPAQMGGRTALHVHQLQAVSSCAGSSIPCMPPSSSFVNSVLLGEALGLLPAGKAAWAPGCQHLATGGRSLHARRNIASCPVLDTHLGWVPTPRRCCSSRLLSACWGSAAHACHTGPHWRCLSQDALPLDAPERPWACWARWSGGLRAWQGG